jgi:hypothetical protein
MGEQDTNQETHGSTQLFAVFMVSIITLVLVPYTAHLFFSSEDDDDSHVSSKVCNV